MIISEAQFIREFEVVQDASFIFFLGAGASRTSGIPTANEMIWFFKRVIYCLVNNISPESCKDLANPYVQ
jgi:NAD-dependent SIR2 family protein deacetylase